MSGRTGFGLQNEKRFLLCINMIFVFHGLYVMFRLKLNADVACKR